MHQVLTATSGFIGEIIQDMISSYITLHTQTEVHKSQGNIHKSYRFLAKIKCLVAFFTAVTSDKKCHSFFVKGVSH